MEHKRLTDKEWKLWYNEELYTSACEPSDIEIHEIYGRLAELEDKIEDGEFVSKDWHDEQILHAENEIQEYKTAIENGTLIELPCNVGTTLYFIYNRPHANKPILTPKIHETSNWYFDIDKKGVAIVARNPYGYNGEYFYYLGKMVFLTKAEAEQRLKELKDE